MKKKALAALLTFCMAFAAAPLDAAAGEFAVEQTDETSLGAASGQSGANGSKATSSAPTSDAHPASPELTPGAQRAASVPGTTYADAIQVECNSPYETTIERETKPGLLGEEIVVIARDHWYRFTLGGSAIVSVTLAHDPENGIISNDMYEIGLDARQDESATLTETSGTGDATVTTAPLALPAGTYYCLVKGDRLRTHEGDSYKITVNCKSVAGACESEPNDSLQAATAMAFDAPMNGSIHDLLRDRADYYRLDAPEDGVLEVTLSHDIIAGKEQQNVLSLSVLDQNGSSYLKEESRGGDREVKTVRMGLSAGTYFLCVSGASVAATAYQLEAHFPKSDDWERERNDSFEAANPLPNGAAMHGSIYKQVGESDFYKFEMTEEGYVQLHTEHASAASASPAYAARLYGGDYSLICETQCKGGETSVDTAKIGIGPGTYYVEVASSGGFVGEYEIEARRKAEDGWEREPNDAAASATPIGGDGLMHGSSLTASDYDWFQFALAEESPVSFGITHEETGSGDLAWRVSLMDANGSMVAVDETGVVDSAGNEKTSTSKPRNLAAGTYYLRVLPGGVTGAGREYSVFFNQITLEKPVMKGAASAAYNKIKVTWNRVPGAVRYLVYRGTKKGGAYEKVKTVQGGAKTSWTDSSVETGKKYFYKIKAVVELDGEQESEFSDPVSGKAIPAKAKLSAKAQKGKVELSWKKVAGASGYEVYRASGSGGFKKTATVKNGKATVLSDGKAKKGGTYRYKIRAYRAAGGKKVRGAFSDVVTVKAK